MKLIKQTSFVLSLFLGLTFSQQSQALISTSLKGGIGFNKMNSSDSGGTAISGSSYGVGYQGGLGLEFGLGVASISADVLLAQRGSFNTLTTSKWKTILVPVQAKFALIPMLSVGVGAYFSSAIGSISTSNALGVSTGSTTFEASGQSTADFGAVASVGISLPLGATTLSLEGRYLYGMKNLQATPVGDSSTKMSAFDMLAGVTF